MPNYNGYGDNRFANDVEKRHEREYYDRHLPPHHPEPEEGQVIAAGGLVILAVPEQETLAERLQRVSDLAAKHARNERLFEPGTVPPIQEDYSNGCGGRRKKRRKKR